MRLRSVEVHARGYHCRGVDEGGHGGRAFHRVRQPHVQRELRALAHRPAEQQQARGGERRGVRPVLPDVPEQKVEVGVPPAHLPEQEDAQQKAGVADAGDQERLPRGRRGAGLLVVVADQEVRAEADALPEGDEQQEVVRQHEPAHAEDEQPHHREVAGEALVAAHVAAGEHRDHRRDERDHAEHDRRERVHGDGEPHLQVPGGEPRHRLRGVDRRARVEHLVEQHEREDGRRAAGDDQRDVRVPLKRGLRDFTYSASDLRDRLQQLAEVDVAKRRQQRRDEWQGEDDEREADGVKHGRPPPQSRWEPAAPRPG